MALVLQYAAFAVAFFIDRWAIRTMTVKEDINPLRNLLHWLLAPPTLFLYSVIAFYAICKFVFVGKVMARHDMAAKEGLGAVTGGSSGANAEDPSTGQEPTGGELGGDIATFYASSSVERKTSMDRNVNNSKDILHALSKHAAEAQSPGVSLKDTTPGTADAGELMCTMPDSFFFGSYGSKGPKRDQKV